MSEDFIGKTIGGYVVESAIGRGGMATVYLARQTSMNRVVALKILPRDQMKDDAYLKRFEREVSIVAQLEHRSIVPVYDHGEHEGQPYIAMRYMSGGSLDAYLQEGVFAPERVLALYQQVAPALDYAHTKGVLHRDLKPSNILLDDAGGAYITDFGIARVFGEHLTTELTLTQHGVVGTPAYMSPEQAQGQPLDGRSDVYSLGVVLFELVTGRRPFNAETPYSIAVMQVTAEPPSPRQFNPDLSLSLEHVILKALRKRPEERFQTATELTEALRMAVENPAGFNPHDTQPNRRPVAEVTQPMAVNMPQFSATPVTPVTPPTPVSGMRAVRVPTNPQPAKRARSGGAGMWMGVTVGALIGCVLLTLIATGIVLIGGQFLAQPTPVTPSRMDGTATPSTEALVSPTPVPGALQTQIAADDRNIPSLATLDALRPGGATPAPLGTGAAYSGRVVYSGVIASSEQITQHLFTRPVQGGAATQLTDGASVNTAPAISPDGRQVAFISDRDGSYDLYVVGLGAVGEPATRVLETPVDEYSPVWTPDGEALVFASDLRGDGALALLRTPADGGEVTALYSELGMRAFRPRFSFDGALMAFVRGQPFDAQTWEIVVMDMETRRLTPLTNNEVMDNWPVFDADGEAVFAVRTLVDAAEIWRIPLADPAAAEPIYRATGWVSSLTLAPDGGALMFSQSPSASATGQIIVLPLNGDGPRTLDIIAGLGADWTP